VPGPVLALASALAGGCGDFVGGTTSRRIGVVRFILCTQLLGLLIAAIWVLASGEPVPPIRVIAAAAGAGFGLTVGIAGFFQAMVVGAISIVAPISATGVALPIIVGIARGEQPDAVQVVGILASICGTMLAARPSSDVPSPVGESGVRLACLGALGNGLYLWLMSPASQHGIGWAMLIVCATPVCLLVPAVIVRRTSLRLVVTSRSVPAIVLAAVLTFTSVTLYAYATRHGQLAIVSVLAALYPVVTVLLAFGVLGERVYGLQRVGVAIVLAGVLLLSA
jgi:drug/metabolite transporter (DMT)-like permease